MPTTLEPPFRASRYTSGAILLHWTIALLIVAQIAGGWSMNALIEEGSRLQFQVYQLHKSFGITVLVLTIARILWRLSNPPPPEPVSVSPLERRVAHAVHMAFYALLLIIPLSGWLMITVSPVQLDTVLFFVEALPWPHLPGFAGLSEGARETLTRAMENVHAVLAYSAGVLILLHVAGALKHQLQDGAFVGRMTGLASGDGPRNSYGHTTTFILTALFAGSMIAAAGLARQDGAEEVAQSNVSPDQAAVLTAADAAGEAAPAAEPAASGEATRAAAEPAASGEVTPAAEPAAFDGPAPGLWTVIAEESVVELSFTFQGSAVKGTIPDFEAEIRFDETNLAASSIAATLDITTADPSELQGSDALAADEHPTASFRSETISRTDEGFLADGVLTIAGNEQPVSLPFDLVMEDGRGIATGSVDVDRLAFGVGPESDEVSAQVAVSVRVVAEPPQDAAAEVTAER